MRIRAVVTIPYTTGLPADVSTNVFHAFTDGLDPVGDQLTLMTALRDFYILDTGVPGTSVGVYYGNLASRTANACRVELFDLDDLPPRQPIDELTFTLPAAGAVGQTPPEVALCMSFQGAPVSGVPQARQRGRVYLGPFHGNVVATTGRPNTTLTSQVATSGGRLIGALDNAGGPIWAVYSRVDDALVQVTDGWVDDEFDTQRRRGRERTTRNPFTA